MNEAGQAYSKAHGLINRSSSVGWTERLTLLAEARQHDRPANGIVARNIAASSRLPERSAGASAPGTRYAPLGDAAINSSPWLFSDFVVARSLTRPSSDRRGSYGRSRRGYAADGTGRAQWPNERNTPDGHPERPAGHGGLLNATTV
jgi:hypothetical protein